MNRSTFILGVALLVVAVTMAVTITFRNAPEDTAGTRIAARKAQYHKVSRAGRRSSALPGRFRDRSSGSELARRPVPREQYEVVIPTDRLMGLPASRRQTLLRQVARVESNARKKLERMTREFDLTTAQRRKMFPLLVRSTPGYDPVMQVAGVAAPVDPTASTDEEIHALLDPDQQAEMEEEEINRRLWWEDLIDRLEKELVDSTGGAEVQPAGEEAPAALPELLGAGTAPAVPAGRPTGNMLESGQ